MHDIIKGTRRRCDTCYSTINTRFFPTEEQASILERWINICRMLYNSTLLDKQRIYKQEKRTYKRKEMQHQ
ncbi:helix-turn-helix domain-containing protein [Bacillaceae bacterium S4-13-58]